MFPTLSAILVACALAVGLWGLWLLWILWHYRIRATPPERLRVLAPDGWRLALHRRRPARRRFQEPVILCHGFAANRHTFDFEPPFSLAHRLAERGFECFTPELRGTGRSGRPPRDRPFSGFSVDDHILRDGPAILDASLRETGAERAFWVGHSMGGLVGYGVAQGPAADRLAGLVALGSPVFFSYDPWLRRAIRVGSVAAWPLGFRQRLLSLSLAPFLGWRTLPLSDVVVNPLHIAPALQRKIYAHLMTTMGRGVLLQLEDWTTHDALRSLDRKVDYREGIARMSQPLLVLAGACDRLAPPEGARRQFELAGSDDKTLWIFGREAGERMDYGHGDLLYGGGAPTEVHPRIAAWLEERATPLGP